MVTPEKYDVAFVEDSVKGIVSNTLSEDVLASANLTLNKVEHNGSTVLTVTITRFDFVDEDPNAVKVVLKATSGTLEFVSHNIASTVVGANEITATDKGFTINNYVEGRTYVFTYVIENITADCDVSVSVSAPTV